MSSSPHHVRIGLFGSCLSSDPAWHLVNHYQCREEFRIFHNRSDQFTKYYIAGAEYPRELHSHAALKPREQHLDDASNILFNQAPETIGFEGTLKRLAAENTLSLELRVREARPDIILIDNFMDVVARLVEEKRRPGASLFYPSHFARDQEDFNASFQLSSYLSPEESAANFLQITRWFKTLCPESTIIFTCWPSTTSRNNKERLYRIIDFYREFSHIAFNENITIIPPLQIPKQLTKGEEDWYHLDSRLYQSLAGIAFYQHASATKLIHSKHINSTY